MKKYFLGLFLVMLIVPFSVSAQQNNDALIAVLMAQLKILQNQVAALQNSTDTNQQVNTSLATDNLSFDHDLFYRGKNDMEEVSALQDFLLEQGVYNGPITGYYGILTRKGIITFQKKYGFSQDGKFSGKTRIKANTLLSQSLTTSTTGQTSNSSPSSSIGNTSSASIIPQVLNVSMDSSTPSSTSISTGQTGVVFAKIKLSVSGSNAVLDKVYVGSDSTGASNSLSNIKIYDGSVLLGSVSSINGSSVAIPITQTTIVDLSSKTLTLVSDITSIASGNLRLGFTGLSYPGSLSMEFRGLPIYGNNMKVISSATTGKPDLSFSNISSSITPIVNQKTRVSFVILNKGTVSVNPNNYDRSFFYDYRFSGGSSDGTTYYVSPTEYQNSCDLITTLVPNQLCQVAVDISFPTVGTKTLSVVLDVANKFGESNEYNNNILLTVNVTSSQISTPVIQQIENPILKITASADSPNGDKVVAGSQQSILSAYDLNATGSTEDVKVTSIKLDFNVSSVGKASDLTNCGFYYNTDKLMINADLVNPYFSGSQLFRFNAPLTISKGEIKKIQLKCDVKVSALNSYQWSLNESPLSTGVSGIATKISMGAIYSNTNVISNGEFSIYADPATPPSQTVAAGSLNVPAAILKFGALYEDVSLKSVTLKLFGSNQYMIKKYSVFDGNTEVGNGFFSDNISVVEFLQPITIPKNGNKSLTIKVDLAKIGEGLTPVKAGDTTVIIYDETKAKGIGFTSANTIYSGYKAYPPTMNTSIGTITLGQ